MSGPTKFEAFCILFEPSIGWESYDDTVNAFNEWQWLHEKRDEKMDRPDYLDDIHRECEVLGGSPRRVAMLLRAFGMQMCGSLGETWTVEILRQQLREYEGTARIVEAQETMEQVRQILKEKKYL